MMIPMIPMERRNCREKAGPLEAGLSLPGCAAIPAPYRERAQIAYDTSMAWSAEQTAIDLCSRELALGDDSRVACVTLLRSSAAGRLDPPEFSYE